MTEELKPRRKYRWTRILGIILMVVLGLFVIAAILLRQPSVQKRVINYVAERVYQKQGLKTTLGSFHLKFLNRLSFNELLIRDIHSDTLFYCENFTTNFGVRFPSIRKPHLTVYNFDLHHAKLRIKQDGEGAYNFQKPVTITPSDGSSNTEVVEPSSAKRQLELLLSSRKGNASLSDVDVTVDSEKDNSFMHYYFGEMNMALKDFRIDHSLELGRVTVKDPIVEIRYGKAENTDGSGASRESSHSETSDYSESTTDVASETEKKDPFKIIIDALDVSGATYRQRNENYDKLNSDYVTDFNDLTINDIDFTVNDVNIIGGNIQGQQLVGDFMMMPALQVNKMNIGELGISDRFISLKNFELRTPTSYLSNYFRMSYDSWTSFQDFFNEVHLSGYLGNSYLSISDLRKVSNEIYEQEFFIKNKDERIVLNGSINGNLNALKAKDFTAKLGQDSALEGDFVFNNLFDPNGKEEVDMDIIEATVSVPDLNRIIPGLKLSSDFTRLGKIRYAGTFDGEFLNFKTAGHLVTNLGEMDLDMALNLINGRDKYSGTLHLDDFHLGRLVGDSLLQRTTGDFKIISGQYFTKDKADAHILASIDDVTYNNYQYRDIDLEGQLSKGLFDGDLHGRDPNAKFDLSGILDFTKEQVSLKVLSDIERVALKPLGFYNKDLTISGDMDVDLSNIDLNDIRGVAKLENVVLTQDTLRTQFKYFNFSASDLVGNRKKFVMDSDIAKAGVTGTFNMEIFLETIALILKEQHPGIYKRLYADGNRVKGFLQANDFDAYVQVDDTYDLLDFLEIDLGRMKDIDANMSFSNNTDAQYEYKLVVNAGDINLRDFKADSLYVAGSGLREGNVWQIKADTLDVKDNMFIGFRSDASLVENEIEYSLSVDDYRNVLDDIYLDGVIGFEKLDEIFVSFYSSNFNLLDKEWELVGDNYIKYGKDYLDIQDIVFQSTDQEIRIKSRNNKTLDVGMTNFEIGFINAFTGLPDMRLAGPADIQFQMVDIFKGEKISLNVFMDKILINDHEYGTLIVKSEGKDWNSLQDLDVNLFKDGSTTSARGSIDIFNTRKTSGPSFDLDFVTERFPLQFLEAITGSLIRETDGFIDGEFKLANDGERFILDGNVFAEGETTIDYLNTTYTIDKTSIPLSSTYIDLGNIVLKDKNDAVADVNGGLYHNGFKDFNIQVEMKSRPGDSFLLMDIPDRNDGSFYGTGKGRAEVAITGPFDKIDIRVDADARRGSILYLPINSTVNTSQFTDYIEFVDSIEVVKPEKRETPRIQGLYLAMNLRVQPEAEVQIIFSDDKNDILRSRGTGDLFIVLNRQGNLSMYNTYNVLSGDYSYSLGRFIRKKFSLNRGGSITWSGDPVNAQIDITASYDLRTSTLGFISEYINGNNDLKGAAQSPTEVNVLLKLHGPLFSPDIGFDLNFPEVTGEIKNFTNQKLAALRQDSDAMTKQTVSVLWWRSFIPLDRLGSNSLYLDAATNTVSEMIAGQVSQILSQYLNEEVSKSVDFIDAFEIDLGYTIRRHGDVDTQTEAILTGVTQQFEARPYFTMLDERLTLTTGVKVLSGVDYKNTNDITHDFILEYAITPDGRVKARVYNRSESINFGKKYKTGVGIVFEDRFDSFREWLRGKSTQLVN